MRQRFVLLSPGAFAPDGHAVEITGRPHDVSIQWSAYSDHVRFGPADISVEIRYTVRDATINTIPAPALSLWDRTVEWLNSCPLLRRPETTAHPVI